MSTTTPIEVPADGAKIVPGQPVPDNPVVPFIEGGGIRSLNVALRQELDLFVCLRPVRWFRGVPSPLKDPSGTDMVIFRENTEDIYAGIEWPAESDAARKVVAFLEDEMSVR